MDVRVAKAAENEFVMEERRAKKQSNKKVEAAEIVYVTIIRSFPSMESHSINAKSDSTKTYLQPDLDIRKMYFMYVTKCQNDNVVPENKKMHRDIFNIELNYSFHARKKVECDFCTTYNNSSIEQKENLRNEYEVQHEVQQSRK